MKNVSRLFIVFLLLTFSVNGQSTSEKLKREQARLERKIADTKSLLTKSKSNTQASLNELKVIENQIVFRESLLRNYDNQIRGAELNIKNKEQEIEELYDKIERLKMQYKKLLLYAYKHRNKYSKMMYVVSAENYNEALKRKKYLERISEIQQKQFLVIKQNQALIKQEITEIEKEKAYKKVVVTEKSKEKKAILQDKLVQEEVYQKFKSQEQELLAKLRKEESRKVVLRNKISAAIRIEIAEAEARRREAEAARKKNTANAGGSVTTKVPDFASTKESARLSASFEGNKGRLPWPVDKGSITEKFGKNPHPTLKNVYTNNRGIDISSPKNAQVRAVFDGEVTSVLSIPGAGKVIILKHGNYRTVYSNLKDTYVSKGDKVTTKKVIGSLLTKDKQNMSVVHFELHKVVGSSVTCLNPTLWVSH
ncbi:MAG: peptidoglycan DD-metalloendopeptidase family protein [Fluviicola sp.]|nr:peptidoglycan DD-metalloendopeptidase family protein [Fluviicola sp.]